MALANATGGAYSAASVKNNAGTIVKGGNVSSDGPIQNVKSLADFANDRGESYGSRVIAADGGADLVGISGAVPGSVVGGTTRLGYQAGATNWVVMGGNVTETLGGVANTQLVGGARDYTGSLNDFDTKANRVIIDAELVGASGFNVFAAPSADMVPGRTRMANAGASFSFVNPADGTDAVASEIAPSQAVPGELTYHFGALAVATTDEYKAKNVAES